MRAVREGVKSRFQAGMEKGNAKYIMVVNFTVQSGNVLAGECVR